MFAEKFCYMFKIVPIPRAPEVFVFNVYLFSLFSPSLEYAHYTLCRPTHPPTHTHIHCTLTFTRVQRVRCKYINLAASDTPERHRERINESDKKTRKLAHRYLVGGKLIKSNRQITSRDTATPPLLLLYNSSPPAPTRQSTVTISPVVLLQLC